ncbi:hypothetical protein CH302_03050 [Rhodococcus sp. 15-2388-1-1a]|uniref:hypothetical protein n=1 Tax=Nocardiaceae TaxID=85025 RepID=UPI00056CE694|nr:MULTISPECIES: hypothetical protein [Rhodococcus]OZF04394.1 hypothetical protein CH302_03050 [Rhodococcus sp. 15-2388-1-1a]
MTSTADLTVLLGSLATRARDTKPKLTAAVGLINDVGRIMTVGRPSDLRSVQTAVAAVREQLDGGDVQNTPTKALNGEHSHVYLAGALWALNEVIDIQLSSIDAVQSQPRRATRKKRIADAALAAMKDTSDVTPSSLLEAVSHIEATVRPDEISRALGDLLADGVIQTSPADRNADRRNKFFTLTTVGRSLTTGDTPR